MHSYDSRHTGASYSPPSGHNLPTQPIDPDRIAAEMERLGHAWSDLHAAACALEEAEKSVLAEITADYRPQAKSQAEAESLARASKRFRDYLADMVEARRKANRAKVSFDTFKVKLEMQRTAAATDRALMSLR